MVEQSSFPLIALFWLKIGRCRGRNWLNGNQALGWLSDKSYCMKGHQLRACFKKQINLTSATELSSKLDIDAQMGFLCLDIYLTIERMYPNYL